MIRGLVLLLLLLPHVHTGDHSPVASAVDPTQSRPGFRLTPARHQSLDLLARLEQGVVSPQHLVTMYLAVDVRKMNLSLLRWFGEGVAAALGVAAGRVHITQLNEQKNAVELYVASPGNSAPWPAEEVVQSLNVKILQRRLSYFGITEVSSETETVWRREGFYSVILFLSVFIIILTCLMLLYHLKEKVQFKGRPPPALPDSATRCSEVIAQAEVPPIPRQQPITARCQALPPSNPLPSTVSVTNNHTPQTTVSTVTTKNELKPCSSPFRMKHAAGLQERRGSNVSLVLDMSALVSVEPLRVSVVTARDSMAREYLMTAGRPMKRHQLRDVINNTKHLQAEFAEIPMNFVDPSMLDIPNHGTKDRYRTILPNPHSRVILRGTNDPLSCYINANYIRGYRGDEKAFIATQGPMMNTVNDFWLMVWEEGSEVIVMITKLKEKNEKCVLYWPERRGIFGKVEVVVNSVRSCEHYTTRSITLKSASDSRLLQHYWFTSWPDHKTPDSAPPLLQLVEEVEMGRRSRGPAVIHCSAGIGRTGCFIATAIGCRQLRAEGVVDLLGIVCSLRLDRGGMVQTEEQYQFIHHALNLYEDRRHREESLP